MTQQKKNASIFFVKVARAIVQEGLPYIYIYIKQYLPRLRNPKMGLKQ